VREGTYVPWWEYSPDGTFDNSPIENKIEFADDFYKNLPKPTIEIKPEAKSETKEFNVGNHVYAFDKGFPATVEIYALGAGGGGQGGHYYYTLTNLVNHTGYCGTGAAGGGGAAIYATFAATENFSLDIVVGKGGSGGNGHDDDRNFDVSGGSGGKGGDTRVTWNGGSIVAGGGLGGGLYKSSDNKDLTGGSGGIPSVNDNAAPGESGRDGSQTGQAESQGGNSAALNIGSLGSFGGGTGGYRNTSGSPCQKGTTQFGAGIGAGGTGGSDQDQSGLKGGDGLVKIVVTYFGRD
jgi:hypothetical protein